MRSAQLRRWTPKLKLEDRPVRAGVWLSSREAVIVKLHPAPRQRLLTQVIRLQSEVEGWHRTTGGRHSRLPYQQASAQAPIENRLKERRERELRAFFKEVIHELEDAHEVIVFGPGVVKSQFEHVTRRLPSWKNRWVHAESADQMTERQVVARTLESLGGGVVRRMPGSTWAGRLSRRRVHEREGGQGELRKKAERASERSSGHAPITVTSASALRGHRPVPELQGAVRKRPESPLKTTRTKSRPGSRKTIPFKS